MKQILKVAGTPVVDFAATADFITDGIQFNFKHPWSFQAIDNAIVGAPDYTVEASNDNVSFVPYDSTKVNQVIPGLQHDKEFAPLWFRIAYKANGATGGTVTFDLNLK